MKEDLTPDELAVIETRALELDDLVLDQARDDAGELITRLLDLDTHQVVKQAWENGVHLGLRATLRVLVEQPDSPADLTTLQGRVARQSSTPAAETGTTSGAQA